LVKDSAIEDPVVSAISVRYALSTDCAASSRHVPVILTTAGTAIGAIVAQARVTPLVITQTHVGSYASSLRVPLWPIAHSAV